MFIHVRVIVIILCLLLMSGCRTEDSNATIEVPDEIAHIVKQVDFEQVDWEKKALRNKGGMVGNEHKSAVIGADMPALEGQKWMWHLWGENMAYSDVMIVGFHRESQDIHPVITDFNSEQASWHIIMGGENNGADAHIPSYIKIPQKGEWAFLLYVNEELFDILVMDIQS